MKAMILAAGYGSRLGPLTERMPKCLVEVGGKRMLEIVIGRLAKTGVTEVVINLHYLAELVEEFVKAQNSFGLTVHFSHELSLLGTGGALKNARDLLNASEPFFVHNADIYSEIDLSGMYRHHTASGALVTLGVMDRPTSRPLLFTSKGLLCGHENRKEETCVVFGNDPAPRALAFSGIQVISPSFFRYLEQYEGSFSSITAFLDAAKAGEAVQLFDVSQSFWADVGTPESLEEVRAAVEGEHH